MFGMLTKEYKKGKRRFLQRNSLRKILFISFLSWASSIWGQETYEVVSTSMLNVRSKPTTKSVVLGKSKTYDQLGFLVASMKNEPVLNNVISAVGQKQNGIITMKIEGDLP